jgi:N6-L-threonylcarbamoyladenine synthase
VRQLEGAGDVAPRVPDLAASFQAAVVDVLVGKTMRAVAETGCRRVLIGGGVAASRPLRSALAAALGPDGQLYYPSPRLATDNGAMIARAAAFRLERGDVAPLGVTARPDMPFPGLVRR